MKIYIVVEKDNEGVYASVYKTEEAARTHITADILVTTHEWGCLLRETKRIFDRESYYRYEYKDKFVEYTIVEGEMEE